MTLLELLELLRRNIKLCIALPAVCFIAACIYCWGLMPNQYTAETSIYALTTSNAESTNVEGVTSSDMTASQQLANDFAELAKNDYIQLLAAKNLGMEDLSGFNVSVASNTNNRVIKLDVTGQDPESCALIANALAKEIGTTAVDVMGVKAVNVISEASTPEKPSGPNRKMYALVALLAGLFLAVALVVLRDMLDTTVRNDDELADILGVPVIGRLPMMNEGR